MLLINILKCKSIRTYPPINYNTHLSHLSNNGILLSRALKSNPFKSSHIRLYSTIDDVSNPDAPGTSIATTEPTALSYSTIEEAFNSAVQDYTERVKKEDSNIAKSPDFEGMTPALKFYNKNKEILLNNAKKIFVEQTSELDLLYRTDDPVIRPPKNYLWEYNSVTNKEQSEKIVLKKGEMPTIETMLKILEQEHLVDSVVVNLDECDRRDIGLYAIVATGKTFAHCRRVGRLLYRIFVDLEIPFVSHASYSWSSRNDQWIIAHLGPLQIHLMTQELRDYYNLEQLWLNKREDNKEMIESAATESQIPAQATSLVASESLVQHDSITISDEDVVYSEFKKDDDYG